MTPRPCPNPVLSAFPLGRAAEYSHGFISRGLANSRTGINHVLVAQGNPYQKIDRAGRDVAGMRERASILPLQLVGAVARIRGKVLVGPVDLTISEQGFTIVMGPNGAGKTTLLRLMHGLQRLSAGALVWNRPRAVVQDRQAFVFQSPIMMRRSVVDNIAYPLMLHGQNKVEARARAQRLAEAFGLGNLLEQSAPVLSGGEKQKLSLARALIREPEILFLDEPCANLDGRATREIETILRNAQEAGTRIVMSTHDMGQARRLARDVVFMYDGKVHECADADAFFGTDHKTPEAAGFVNGDIVE